MTAKFDVIKISLKLIKKLVQQGFDNFKNFFKE